MRAGHQREPEGEKSSSQHALGLLVVHLKVSSNIIRQIKSGSEGGDSDKV